MKNELYLISICIPSYNRPSELKRLLESIDSRHIALIQIVICEDNAPARAEVTKVVGQYITNSKYKVKYIENEINLGYDKNLKALINHSDGEYVMFMGDDDMFIPSALDQYIEFLLNNKDCGYVLRSYRNVYKDGTIEYFRYFENSRRFDAGLETYINLFDKSVFISGFCIKKEYTLSFLTDKLDGSLLFQLYLLAEICLRYPSAYCDIPLTQAKVGDSKPMFGSCETEKDLYTPGSITIENSINFLKKHFEVIKYIDEVNSINSLPIVKKQLSKFSYPSLSLHRDKGIVEYRKYVKELRKINYDSSIYFEFYNLGLILLGKRRCDMIIRQIKKIIGKRPTL